MSDLTWTNEQRKLSDLVPWEHNPKRMTKKQADGLRASIEHFGFAVPFLVSPDGDIYDGHQRQTLMSAIKEYGPNATVDVRVSSRPLTDDERRELVVRLKQNQAGWDFDMLANEWDAASLVEWGFEPGELGIVPSGDEWGSALSGLPDSDRAPFQQMTFTLHDEQVEQVKRALTVAGKVGDFTGSPNENSNGNALAFMAETFITDYGDGR